METRIVAFLAQVPLNEDLMGGLEQDTGMRKDKGDSVQDVSTMIGMLTATDSLIKAVLQQGKSKHFLCPFVTRH